MKFARIEMLFFVWIVPLLAMVYIYGWRKRRRILNGYATPKTQAVIVPPGMVRKRAVTAILALAAVICTVSALSGPQYGFQWQTFERKGVDIIVALDCSRSMLARDVQPTRLDRAKREIVDLLDMLQGDRVGLVAFSGAAFLQCPLTIDYPAFYLFLDVLTPDYLPVGGTDLTAAVQSAQDAFDPRSHADKAVILITDGEHTGPDDPLEAAKAALKSGIKLFTIGVGSGAGVPVPQDQGGFKKDTAGQIVLSRLDESLLSRMALVTGGSYVRSVAGDMDLKTIYAGQIRARMQDATVENGRKRIWADRYQWPLAVAVAVLLLTRWIPPVSQITVLALVIAGTMAGPSAAAAGPVQKGYDAYREGNYGQALKHFIDGQVADPENPALLYNIGNTYYKKGDFEAAATHFRQALVTAPNELLHRLYYNLGNSTYRSGRLEAAVQNYEAALQLEPDDLQIKENLAFVKAQLKRQQQNMPAGENRKSDQDGDPQPPQQGADSGQPEQPPSSNGAPPSAQKQPLKPDQGAAEPPAGEKNAGRNKTGEADQRVASQMLNRLKDQPGRAMMPDYQKRSVEKDW